VQRNGSLMRPSTIIRVQLQLPATREELEQRLGLKPGSAQYVVRHMLKNGYGIKLDNKLTSKGALAPVLYFTEKKTILT